MAHTNMKYRTKDRYSSKGFSPAVKGGWGDKNSSASSWTDMCIEQNVCKMQRNEPFGESERIPFSLIPAMTDCTLTKGLH